MLQRYLPSRHTVHTGCAAANDAVRHRGPQPVSPQTTASDRPGLFNNSDRCDQSFLGFLSLLDRCTLLVQKRFQKFCTLSWDNSACSAVPLRGVESPCFHIQPQGWLLGYFHRLGLRGSFGAILSATFRFSSRFSPLFGNPSA